GLIRLVEPRQHGLPETGMDGGLLGKFGSNRLQLLTLILGLGMPERHVRPSARARVRRNTSWQHMSQTLRAGVNLIRLRPALLSLPVIAALGSVSGAGVGRLWQYHLLHTFTFPMLGHLHLPPGSASLRPSLQ